MVIARIGLIIGLLGVILVMGVMFYEMVLGPDALDWSEESIQRTLESGEWLPLIIVPIVLIITGVAFIPFWRIIFPDVIKNGETAPARVLKVSDTGVTVNDDPQVALTLEITPSSIGPYEAEVRTIVSRLNASLVRPGIAAEVVFDPKKPSRVQLTSLEIPAAAAPGSSAARMNELNDLRDQHLISEEEYEAKRKEILEAL